MVPGGVPIIEREKEMERRGEERERHLEPSESAEVDSLFPFFQSSFCLILP
jgi:hypothetical protein